MTAWWSYDAWAPCAPRQGWPPEAWVEPGHDDLDFHVDLGCGRLKKGRIGIDRFPDPGVNAVMDLDRLLTYSHAHEPNEDAPWDEGISRLGPLPELAGRLPFPDRSVRSVISHHCLEHIGDGFIPLVDEVYRVLEPGGVFRAITPLFPSRTAVEDPDHRRYFMEGTWESFCGTPGDQPHQCWLGSFSTPYTKSRFELVSKSCTPAVPVEQQWGPEDAREIRVTLRAVK